jgi:hypothetical protein
VAIGIQAGYTNQAANSIILNATGATLNQTTANTFTVKPVRQDETADAMYYNSSTGEITYADAFSFSVAGDDSTQRLISSGELIKFIGAGTVTTASDAEGNITITGSNFFNKNSLTLTLNSNYTWDNWDESGDDAEIVELIPNGANRDIAIGDPTNGRIYTFINSSNTYSVTLKNGVLLSGSTITTLTPNTSVTVTKEPSESGNIWVVISETGKITNGAYTASLGNTGALTLPAGGVISEGGGISGAIKLTPAGGANANQALLIYPTAGGEGDHIHLTAGGGTTELYLGNDTHYVKLVNGGNVELRAATANLSAQAAWTFETDGELDTIRTLGIKVPNGVPTDVAVINSTTGSWEMNPNLSLATTGGSGSGLTVNVSEDGGYASTIAIATAGTGYNNGDLITVTSGSSNATFTIVIGGRNTWTFGIDGNLTLPNGAVLRNLANSAIAFGQSAGANNSQGATAIAIGTDAGYYTQGAGAVAIGESAGESYQGVNAIAIGKKAGYYYQAANSIILNATGDPLEQTTANTFTVAPIRNISATSGVLQYNDSTKEVSYSNSVTAESFNTDQITVVGNRITTTVTNATLELEGNGSAGVVINTLAEATTASTSRAVGYLGLPRTNSSLTQTLTIADSGKHVYLTTTGQTITIPAAASVAYPIGTTITFIAGSTATTTTIAIDTDTMYLAGTGTTGSRTLAAHGMATAVKVNGTSSSGVWYINGTGLT